LAIVALALIGFGISLYLSLFQWGVFAQVWEPFFGDDSRRILRETWISNLLPIPDAFLGAVSYLADAVLGLIGSRARWRTLPWVVLAFGFVIGPVGLTSVMLVIVQPVLFDAWCTLCLASAFVSVLMIGPAADEVLATLQYLRRVHLAGYPVWRAIWGLENPEIPAALPATAPSDQAAPPSSARRLAVLSKLLAAGVGTWLMVAPFALGYAGTLAGRQDRIIGPLAVTFAIIAVFGVTRPVGRLVIPLGVWLLVSPWLLGFDAPATWNSMISGTALLLFALPSAANRHAYGGGWRMCWRTGGIEQTCHAATSASRARYNPDDEADVGTIRP
jgi:hypothetical protein